VIYSYSERGKNKEKENKKNKKFFKKTLDKAKKHDIIKS